MEKKKNAKDIKLICFDVDDTLVGGSSWQIITEGLGCSRERAVFIYEKAKRGEISFREAEKDFVKMWKESGNANKKFIRKIADERKIRAGAEELVSCLRKKRYLMYLISGSIDILIESVAEKLKFDGFYANSHFEFDEKGILSKIFYRENQGKNKTGTAQGIIQKNRHRHGGNYFCRG